MAGSKTFDKLGLDADIMSAIADLGFEMPTEVQAVVIPRLLKSSRDFVGLAQTGTGKTAAFGLPVIQQIDTTSKDTQALILCPTRELCLQITRDFKTFCKHKKNIRVLAVYGGSSIETQISALNKGVHIIVATPGRINDLLRRKRARLGNVQKVVLDEADEMLNMGFQKDLEIILKQVPDEAQTLLFSATMPRQVAAIAGNYMHDAEEVTIGTRNAGAENVTHVCYTVHAKDRYKALKRIADFYPNMYGIIFCRTRRETQDVADKLMKDGYNADALHGDLTQAQRDRVMGKLRMKNLHMLVATDVAARGLDVTDLTHIINYNLPDELDSYTHRSGRTGRAGKKGMSVVIVHMREKSKILRIQKIIGKKFEFRKVPSGRQVCAAQLIGLIGRVKDVEVDHEHIDQYLPEIQEMLKGMSREELIKHFVSLEFNRFLEYYRDAPDLNVNEEDMYQSEKGGRRSRRGDDFDMAPRGATSGFTKLFINLGLKDDLSPKKLMEFVNDVTPGKTVEIGLIKVLNTYSFFEVKTGESEKVIDSLGRIEYEDRMVRVEPVDDSRGMQDCRERSRPTGRRGGSGSFGGRPRSSDRSRPRNSGRTPTRSKSGGRPGSMSRKPRKKGRGQGSGRR